MEDTTRKPCKVIVAGHVEPELAQAVRRLADLGNRSVSREVDAALRRHVMLEQLSSEPAGRSTPEPPAAPAAPTARRIMPPEPPRRIETSLVVAEGFTDREGGEWERGDRAPLARRAVREAAMEHPDWFRIEYETVELTSREEWLAAIHENYEARYRQAKQRRDGAQEREQAALRAQLKEQERGQPDLERRYEQQQKEREAREKARRDEHERRQIENELELGALPSGFHYDR